MRARWLGMAGIVACATWSTPAGTVGAQARPERQEIRRPAGWDAATHGDNVGPDYQPLFGMNTVHELRIVIAGDQFRAMQEDLRTLAPSNPGFRGFSAGPLAGAGAPGALGGPGAIGDGFQQFAAFAEGIAAACSEKTANASCSVNGIDGKCLELGPGPRLCLPAAIGDIVAGLPGRGAGPGLGGPLAMIGRDPVYVPVTVQHDGRAWTHVGMRYKGNSSLMMASVGGDGKIPFRLDFDRYEDEFPEIRNQRFYGFQELTFSSNFGDDSQIRELFATEVFRDRGVPAARAAFYRVFVDAGAGPEYWGLYTMIEDPADGAMLDAQFGGRGGNLYKPDGPGANWTQFAAEGFQRRPTRGRPTSATLKRRSPRCTRSPAPAARCGAQRWKRASTWISSCAGLR